MNRTGNSHIPNLRGNGVLTIVFSQHGRGSLDQIIYACATLSIETRGKFLITCRVNLTRNLIFIMSNATCVRHAILSFGQDCVVLATKLQRLKKEEGCRRIFRTLQCARNAVLTRAIGAWMIWAVKDDYIHKVSVVWCCSTNSVLKTTYSPKFLWS